MKQHYKLELLDNAIDYLNEAMKYYEEAREKDGDDRLYKFCILHSISFAELFLKHYVSLESKLLIYSDVTERTIKEDSKTITMDGAIKILENLKKNNLPQLISEIKILKRLRNNAVHHRISYNPSEISDNIGQLLLVFIQFDESNQNVGIEKRISQKYRETLSLIKDGYVKKLEQAVERMNLRVANLHDEGSDFALNLDCENCENKTLYKIDGHYECTFCGEKFNHLKECNICGESYDEYELPDSKGLCSHHENMMSRDD